MKAKKKTVKPSAVIAGEVAPVAQTDNCALCGRVKIDHFFSEMKCKPHRADVFKVAS